MREGGLGAPVRHPLDWENPDFYDEAKLDAELRRVFDICHGCRRCFNLCDSFPRLFDLVDGSKSGELDTVDSSDFAPSRGGLHALRHVLHDEVPLCAAARIQSRFPASDAALSRGGGARRAIPASSIASSPRPTATASSRALAPGSANWATDASNTTMRGLLERVAGLHREAALPKYSGPEFCGAGRREARRR